MCIDRITKNRCYDYSKLIFGLLYCCLLSYNIITNIINYKI